MHNVKCDMLCHMSHSTIPYHITYHSIITTLDCIPICKRERTHTHTNALSLKTIWIIEHSIRLWRDDDEMFLSLCVCSMGIQNFCVDFAGLLTFRISRCSQIHLYLSMRSINFWIFINFRIDRIIIYQHTNTPHIPCVYTHAATIPIYRDYHIEWLNTQTHAQTRNRFIYSSNLKSKW